MGALNDTVAIDHVVAIMRSPLAELKEKNILHLTLSQFSKLAKPIHGILKQTFTKYKLILFITLRKQLCEILPENITSYR